MANQEEHVKSPDTNSPAGSSENISNQGPLYLHEVLEDEYTNLHGPLPDAYYQQQKPLEDALEEARKAANSERGKAIEDRLLKNIYAQIHALPQKRSALCISGGGIRSASFGLGVLQGLARHGLLGNFDYLSTVSGGGYLGSWLTAWVDRHPKKLEGVISDLSNVDPKTQKHIAPESISQPEPKPIRHLRAFSNYLSPKLGFLSADTWTLAATYIRNLVLIWLVLIPLIAAVLMVPRICVAVINSAPDESFRWWLELLFGVVLVSAILAIVYLGMKRLRKRTRPASAPANATQGREQNIKNWVIFLLAFIAIILIGLRIYTVVTQWPMDGEYGVYQWWVKWLFRIAFFSAAWAIAYMGLKRPSNGAQTEQKWFLCFCLIPLLLSAVMFTTYWALFRDPNLSVDDQFVQLAEDTGFPLSYMPNNTLLRFIIFGISLHLVGGIFWAIGGVIESAWRKWTGKQKERADLANLDKRNMHPIRNRLVELLLIVLTGGFGGWLAWLAAVKLFPSPKDRPELYVCFAAPLFISLFLTIVILFAGLSSRWTSDEDREWWARMGAWILIVAVLWSILSVLVNYGPMLFTRIPAVILPSVGGVSGLITLLLGGSSKTDAEKKGESKGGLKSAITNMALVLAAPLFAAFIIILISALSTLLISWLSSKIDISPGWHPGLSFEDWHRLVLRYSPAWFVFSIAIVLLIFCLLMARAINTNKFSLHAMYRNRLIRAYLGASNDKRNPNRFTGFDDHDNIAMYKLWPNNKSDKERNKLLYVVNMALNLVSGDNLAWQERKAESFTVSALHAGNKDLGYRRTQYDKGPDNERYYGGEQGISLGTAVTISGAAASPNMGYHSSTFVTFLLSLFNVRLGWWLGNTGKSGADTYFLESPRLALRPIVEETLGLTDDENPYIYLSDGGHFENLGLYEMVLRRCRFIMVSDAGQDQGCSFEDLGNAVRKIRIDLGVEIDLNQPICITARSDDKEQNAAGRYAAIGTIKYSCVDGTPSSEDGVLIYIKPAFYGREPRDIYQYAQKNAQFPHESTSDQFFSESQLESYRMLGSFTVESIFTDWDDGDKQRYLSQPDFSLIKTHIEKVYLKYGQPALPKSG